MYAVHVNTSYNQLIWLFIEQRNENLGNWMNGTCKSSTVTKIQSKKIVLRVITLFETLEREQKLFNNVLLHN